MYYDIYKYMSIIKCTTTEVEKYVMSDDVEKFMMTDKFKLFEEKCEKMNALFSNYTSRVNLYKKRKTYYLQRCLYCL